MVRRLFCCKELEGKGRIGKEFEERELWEFVGKVKQLK